MMLKRRQARRLHRGGGIGIGIGDGSVSDGEVTSLVAAQLTPLTSSRLYHHSHQQQQQRPMRLRDALVCPAAPRRVMQAIRESPEISSNPPETRYDKLIRDTDMTSFHVRPTTITRLMMKD